MTSTVAVGADNGRVPETAELIELLGLRDSALRLLAAESDPLLADDAVEPLRRDTADRYEHYVATHGPLNRGELVDRGTDPRTGEPRLTWRRPDLGGFRGDSEYLAVMALETYDPVTHIAAAAPILRRRVHGRRQPAEHANTSYEAMLVCLAEGEIDLERVAALLDLPDIAAAEVAISAHAFRDPDSDGAWVPAFRYLAGDVRSKHRVAEVAAADNPTYQRNADALADAVPPDLGPLDISVSLGSPWVAAEDVEAFVHEVLGGRVRVFHLPAVAHWKIVRMGRVPPGAFGDYGTTRLNAYDLLTIGLNGRAPIVYETRYFNGRRARVRDESESLLAQEKLSALHDRFRVWVWEDAARSARLCDDYNRRFNTFVPRRQDGTQLTFPGLTDHVELWSWQRDIVARIVSSPATLCAHAVGGGKTLSMVCTAMTARRLGLARKPLITVPAHLVEQVAREARQAYPFGRFLIAGERDGEPRELLAARCATGDWDAVIVSHGTFSALPVSVAAQRAWWEQQLADAERDLRSGFGGRHGRDALRRRVASFEARVDALDGATDPAVTFERLGTDLLLVDEAHYFKRLPVTSRMAGFSLGSSQRAADLLMKARHLRELRGSLPSLALFTGTPWSNTIAETFVWQTLVQPDVLAAAGIAHFDAWASTFVDFVHSVEVTPDGSDLRLVQRPSRIRNLPELRRMLARSADVLPADALGLDRPDRHDSTIVCDPTPKQLEYVRSLGARADKIHRETVKSDRGADNMLVVCGDGRRAALDPRLVGVREDSSKLTALADEVARIHRLDAGVRFAGSDAPGVFQVIFCDQGTPGPNGTQTYGRIRIALSERGIPPDRIRWVHDARTPRGRAELFDACRDGSVSVLIGSTDKLGVGSNVQTRLRAVHHADAPWRPSDVEQREGRAFRPGNQNGVVDVFRYVTRGTFDAYMWQTLERKATFVAQLHREESDTREIDDLGDVALSYAEVKALAAGNPALLEHARAAADVARLRILQALDAQTLTAARSRRTENEQALYRHHQHEKLLVGARERLATHSAANDALDGPRAATAELVRRLQADGTDPDPAPVRASWRGLGIELIPDGGWRSAAADVVLRVTLAHRKVDEVRLARHELLADAAPDLVSTALIEWAERLDDRVQQISRAAVDAYDTAEDAKHVLREHRFRHADDLAAAESRLADLGTALEASLRTT